MDLESRLPREREREREDGRDDAGMLGEIEPGSCKFVSWM